MRLAQKLGVFLGLGAHSLQTTTRMELGSIASHKKEVRVAREGGKRQQ